MNVQRISVNGGTLLLGDTIGFQAMTLDGKTVAITATAEDIARSIHTHPTLPEAILEAVEAAEGKAIHIYKPPRRK